MIEGSVRSEVVGDRLLTIVNRRRALLRFEMFVCQLSCLTGCGIIARNGDAAIPGGGAWSQVAEIFGPA